MGMEMGMGMEMASASKMDGRVTGSPERHPMAVEGRGLIEMMQRRGMGADHRVWEGSRPQGVGGEPT